MKVEICLWRTASEYKITPKVASVNTQNDFKYEVFHYMFAPTSRIKSEAGNRKPENWLLKHLTVSSVSGDFFQTE